jgi:hypothetical protein
METGNHTVRTLLGVQLYEITDNYLFKLREKQKIPENIFKFLPKYTLNEKNNKCPTLSDFYLQYMGFSYKDEPQKFLIFNLDTIDSLLKEEIDNAGCDDLFKNFNFEHILSVFTPHTEEDLMHHIIPTTNYIVVEINYDITFDDYSGGYDGDSTIRIVGYLNEKLEIVYY